MDRNRALGLLLLVLAVVYALAIDDIPLDAWARDEALNARTLPTFLAGGLGTLATILLVTGGGGAIEGIPWRSLGRLAAMLGLMLAFIVTLELAGFWIAAPIFLVAGLLLMGERRPLLLVGLPLVTVALAWLLLVVLLGAYLPTGALWGHV